MDFDALGGCFTSTSCVVTQISAGMIIGMLLFLVASGLTLIFGVLGVINFAHGSFYMLGAYFAYTVYQLTTSFVLATLGGALGVMIFGILFERLLLSRIYGANVLMQLLVCYAVILILDDLAKIIWGAEFIKMPMPAEFRVPPIRMGGGIVPVYYVVLTGLTVAIALGMGWLMSGTRFGKTVHAAAQNKNMVAALGINTTALYIAVFGLGSLLAGVAGGLAAPIRSLVPGMGVSILIESFIVTVIGGMGSIAGAFVAAILLGLTRAFGSIGFPLFTEGVMFLLMAIILLVKPSGLFGQREA
ncbi:MAG TPA: branched-chain amino acid ABC transporter permease [Alphaproteobacteria bacterium]|nr:branched-chain amino acid ABC transporter permease [Alphaproteobacteria bacterium]